MTSSPHALEPHRATARLDIWTVNVTEPVFVGCLSSKEPVPAICRPAALLGAHLCCHQQPGMSETRSFRWDGEQMSSHGGAETAEAGESREEVIDPLVSSGRGGCGVLVVLVIMSDMMGGGAHLPPLCCPTSRQLPPLRSFQRLHPGFRARPKHPVCKQFCFAKISLFASIASLWLPYNISL